MNIVKNALALLNLNANLVKKDFLLIKINVNNVKLDRASLSIQIYVKTVKIIVMYVQL